MAEGDYIEMSSMAAIGSTGLKGISSIGGTTSSVSEVDDAAAATDPHPRYNINLKNLIYLGNSQE